jgi:hypothetical protein
MLPAIALMDPRPFPPVALKLTGNICPTCQYPVGLVTWEQHSLQVLFCPACENGWTREKSRWPSGRDTARS